MPKKSRNRTVKINLKELFYDTDVVDFAYCCGASELGPIDCNPRYALCALAENYKGGGRTPLIFFTDAVQFGFGAKLAKYIRGQKMGSVVSSASVYNANSGNNVKGWIWAVDKLAFDRWCDRNIEGWNKEN